MLPVTEGLLIAVLGTVFVVWQIAQCLRQVALHIRWARWLVIGKMDCDGLIDKLMSVADPQSAGTGLAEGGFTGSRPSGDARGGRTGAKSARTARCDRGGRPSRAVWTRSPRENIHRRSNRHSG